VGHQETARVQDAVGALRGTAAEGMGRGLDSGRGVKGASRV